MKTNHPRQHIFSLTNHRVPQYWHHMNHFASSFVCPGLKKSTPESLLIAQSDLGNIKPNFVYEWAAQSGPFSVRRPSVVWTFALSSRPFLFRTRPLCCGFVAGNVDLGAVDLGANHLPSSSTLNSAPRRVHQVAQRVAYYTAYESRVASNSSSGLCSYAEWRHNSVSVCLFGFPEEILIARSFFKLRSCKSTLDFHVVVCWLHL